MLGWFEWLNRVVFGTLLGAGYVVYALIGAFIVGSVVTVLLGPVFGLIAAIIYLYHLRENF